MNISRLPFSEILYPPLLIDTLDTHKSWGEIIKEKEQEKTPFMEISMRCNRKRDGGLCRVPQHDGKEDGEYGF